MCKTVFQNSEIISRHIYFFTTDITVKAGIERITINLANWFARQGCDVTIVSNFKSGNMPAYNADSKIKFDFLSEKKFTGTPGSIKRLKLFINNLSRINQYFSTINNSIIILQAFPNAFMFWFATKKKKNLVYAVEHVKYFYYNRIIRLFRLFVYKNFNRIVVLTREDFECYKKHGIHVIMIPNGIVLPKTIAETEREPVICSIGRLDYQKRFDVLISIFARLHEKYTDWKLEIYGEGVLRKKLENQIHTLKLEDCCFLKGITDNVNSVLQKKSIFVVSSEYEGFSIVLIEAMSNGIACVSFDCPTGPGEILTNGVDGLLVENQNKHEMYNAIEFLIKNHQKCSEFGKNAMQSVKKYSIDNVGKQWMDLFSEK